MQNAVLFDIRRIGLLVLASTKFRQAHSFEYDVQVRTLVQQDFDRALAEYDVLLTPVAPTPAYKLGEKLDDPVAMYAGDLMTVNVNLAGLPAIVLNAGFTEQDGVQLPVGIQLIGGRLDEGQLIDVAHKFELTCEAAGKYPEE